MSSHPGPASPPPAGSKYVPVRRQAAAGEPNEWRYINVRRFARTPPPAPLDAAGVTGCLKAGAHIAVDRAGHKTCWKHTADGDVWLVHRPWAQAHDRYPGGSGRLP